MKNILVATDGSASSRRAVAKAAELARQLGAKLTIVNVVDVQPLGDTYRQFAEVELAGASTGPRAQVTPLLPESYGAQNVTEAISAFDAQSWAFAQLVSDRILADAAHAADSSGVVDIAKISVSGDAANQIVTTAGSVGADMIVLGRRGLSGIAELLLGSVSQKVMHHANVDVLIVV